MTNADPLDQTHIEMHMYPSTKVSNTNCTSSLPDLGTLETKLDKLEEKMDCIDQMFSDMMTKIMPVIQRMATEASGETRQERKDKRRHKCEKDC